MTGIRSPAPLWLNTVPYFAGQLLAVALLVAPWLILRRWKWGRLALIAAHAVIALAAAMAALNPYFPQEDRPTWAHFAPLLAVVILAKYDRPRLEGTTAEADG